MRATVLPPVLGPLITSTGSPKPTRIDTGTGSRCERPIDTEALGEVGHEQRVPRLPEVEAKVGRDLGLDRTHVAGQHGQGLDRVQLAHGFGRSAEVVGPVAHADGQRLQDPDDLAPLLVLKLDDVVVEVDRGQRLHEHALPRARASVHDPRDLAAVLGLQQHHVAVVARGDELVLEHAVGVLALEEGLHHRGEPRTEPHQGPPRLGELGRGVVRDFATRKDGAADRGRHLGRVAHERRTVGESGRAFVAGDAAGDLDRALDERRHVGKG